jgi:hypothetical protein
MQQSEEESLEDYLERFLYNYQKTKQFSLDTATIRTIFLKGVRDDYIKVLNLMIYRDVYQNTFADIAKYCKRYFRSQDKIGKSVRDPTNRITKSTSGGVTRIELGNLLENFKIDILNTISSQLDTIKIKRKQEEENATLAIFCPRCRKRHPEKECPHNVIEICGLCIEYHHTNEFPSLPRLKSIFKGGGETHETSYPPKRPWRQQNPNMFVGTRADPWFNATTMHQQALTIGPFINTCEGYIVSPKLAIGGCRTQVSTTRRNAKWIQSNNTQPSSYPLSSLNLLRRLYLGSNTIS